MVSAEVAWFVFLRNRPSCLHSVIETMLTAIETNFVEAPANAFAYSTLPVVLELATPPTAPPLSLFRQIMNSCRPLVTGKC